MGRPHARLRLGIDADHDAQVFGQGINYFHIENLPSIAHRYSIVPLKGSSLWTWLTRCRYGRIALRSLSAIRLRLMAARPGLSTWWFRDTADWGLDWEYAHRYSTAPFPTRSSNTQLNHPIRGDSQRAEDAGIGEISTTGAVAQTQRALTREVAEAFRAAGLFGNKSQFFCQDSLVEWHVQDRVGLFARLH